MAIRSTFFIFWTKRHKIDEILALLTTKLSSFILNYTLCDEEAVAVSDRETKIQIEKQSQNQIHKGSKQTCNILHRFPY